MSCESSNLRTHVAALWDRIRRSVIAAVGGRCELCGRIGRRVANVRSVGQLEAHELWRYDDEHRVQILERVQCLCSDCYQAVHWSLPTPPADDGNRFWLGPYLATIEMIEKAGWRADQIDEHHQEVLRRLVRRNAVAAWELDLSGAVTYGVDLGVLDPNARLVVHPLSSRAHLLRAREHQATEVRYRRRVMRCEQTGPAEGDYRYLLGVRVAATGNRLAVLQKNPSTAGDTQSDATAGKVEAWARRHGFATVVFLNLFAVRHTHADEMFELDPSIAIGPENDRWIVFSTRHVMVTVAAWGECKPTYRNRYDARIIDVVAQIGAGRLSVVGDLTKRGYPRHGLLWNGNPDLRSW